TLQQLRHELSTRNVSSVEATNDCLDRIQLNEPALNAYISVFWDAALDEAHRRDEERSRGHDGGALMGVPLAVKDNIAVAGARMTAGSALLRQHVPTSDATVVKKLRQAGAVIIGKTNLHEF